MEKSMTIPGITGSSKTPVGVHEKSIEKTCELVSNFSEEECKAVAAVLVRKHPDIVAQALIDNHMNLRTQLNVIRDVMKGDI